MTAASLVLVCAIACCSWLLLAAAIPIARLRARRRLPAGRAEVTEGWVLPAPSGEHAGRRTVDDDEARVLLLRGLRSAELDVRMASVTALLSLTSDRYEWAVDGLIEALADEHATPDRVASALDDLAPRPGAGSCRCFGTRASSSASRSSACSPVTPICPVGTSRS